MEVGLKGSLLDKSLYFALAVYEQERTDYAAQQTVTNQASRTEGVELEVRWAVNDQLLLTLGHSRIEGGQPEHARRGIAVQLHRRRRCARHPS